MKCRECDKQLVVQRRCRQVRLQCTGCRKEFRIHEIAADLDRETEAELERFTCIIYD